jgi:hypothetical protein
MEPLTAKDLRWTSLGLSRVEDHEPFELLLMDEDDPVLVYIGQLQHELRTVRQLWKDTIDALTDTAQALAREKRKQRRG